MAKFNRSEPGRVFHGAFADALSSAFGGASVHVTEKEIRQPKANHERGESMKREPQSLTVHLREAGRRINRATSTISRGMVALHCGRVLALTRGNTSKVRKLFFADPMSLEDKAIALERNLSPTDRRQAARCARFVAEIENLYDIAGRLKARLDNCYIKVKRYSVLVAAEEKKEQSAACKKTPNGNRLSNRAAK